MKSQELAKTHFLNSTFEPSPKNRMSPFISSYEHYVKILSPTDAEIFIDTKLVASICHSASEIKVYFTNGNPLIINNDFFSIRMEDSYEQIYLIMLKAKMYVSNPDSL